MASREFPRYATEAKIILRHGMTSADGRTKNVSRGGVCAQVSGALPVGAEISVELSLIFDDNNTSETLALPGRVVWSTPLDDHHQVGLAFLALGADQTKYLDLFLRYLADQPTRQTGESDHADLFTERRNKRS